MVSSVISVGNVTVSSVGVLGNANNVGTSGAVGTAGTSGTVAKTSSGKGSSSNSGKDRGGGSGSKGSGAGSNSKEKKESMPFVGDVMEVRVWGRALSAEEIISGSNSNPVCLFICLSVHLSVCLSVRPSGYLSACMSVARSMCLFGPNQPHSTVTNLIRPADPAIRV